MQASVEIGKHLQLLFKDIHKVPFAVGTLSFHQRPYFMQTVTCYSIMNECFCFVLSPQPKGVFRFCKVATIKAMKIYNFI